MVPGQDRFTLSARGAPLLEQDKSGPRYHENLKPGLVPGFSYPPIAHSMSALPPEADIQLILVKGSANDPKQISRIWHEYRMTRASPGDGTFGEVCPYTTNSYAGTSSR